MRARVLRFLILGCLALGVWSSGAASAAAPPASRLGVAAATPRAAVVAIIKPFYNRSAQSAPCNAAVERLAACPIAPRLRAAVAREFAWEHKHTRGGNGNEFCRCQNTPRAVVISGVKAPYVNASGWFAEVETIWYWGSRPINITWLTHRVSGRWQVVNNFCSGYPYKDLYHIPVGPCPAM